MGPPDHAGCPRSSRISPPRRRKALLEMMKEEHPRDVQELAPRLSRGHNNQPHTAWGGLMSPTRWRWASPPATVAEPSEIFRKSAGPEGRASSLTWLDETNRHLVGVVPLRVCLHATRGSTTGRWFWAIRYRAW